MIGKLFGRGEGGTPGRKKDKAVVHKFVPEEVLYPEGRKISEADTSWMDDVFDQPKSSGSNASDAKVADRAEPPAPPVAWRAADPGTSVGRIGVTPNSPPNCKSSADSKRWSSMRIATWAVETEQLLVVLKNQNYPEHE